MHLRILKNIAIKFLVLFVLKSPVFAQNESSHYSPNYSLDEYRRTVLVNRVKTFVDARENALLNCSNIDQNAADLSLSIGRLSLFYTHSRVASVDHVLKMLEAYKLSEKILSELIQKKSPCVKLIKAAEQKIYDRERKKFKILYHGASLTRIPMLPVQSLSPFEILLMQLDPSCYSQTMPDYQKSRVDGNPCTAGYLLVLDSLKDLPKTKIASFDHVALMMDQFLKNLGGALKSKRSNSIDLTKISAFDLSKAKQRRQFLGILSFLYASSGSRIGMVTPFGDEFWKNPLKLRQAPIYSYNQYMFFMNRKDQFMSMINFAKNNNIVLKISLPKTNAAVNITEWNRHNFISAYLACDYEQKGLKSIAKLIPTALGVAYESKDFWSHLKEGVGFKQSVTNYNQDTSRHRLGAKFGYNFCKN